MASTGTYTNTFRTGYAIKIVWDVTAQSIPDNTSTVSVKVQLASLGSSYTINSSASKSGTLSINGVSYSFSFNASLSGNQTKTIYTKSVKVAHNANGAKTCAFSATAGINVTLSGTYYGNVTASGTGTFDTIPRASTIASVTSSVAINGTNTCAVSITRASSSFTHTVVWKLGSYSKTTEGVGTSTSYAIPLTWLNAIPSATSGTGTVTITTYNGSTKVGASVSKSFTVTVPATVVPTISAVSLSEAVSSINAQFSAYVQNKSKIKATVSASGTYSSTIKTYKATIAGQTFHTSSFTTGVITKSGTLSLVVTVTDSRGRTATHTTNVTVLAYALPTISSLSCVRCTADGTNHIEGTYLKATIGLSISSVNNLNSKAYTLAYKKQSDTTWTTLTTGSAYSYSGTYLSTGAILDGNYAYQVRLSVTDFFGTMNKIVDIGTAFALIDFNASGRGIAFGKVSEKEGIEFALPTTFKYGEIPKDAIALDGTADLDTILAPGYYVFSSSNSALIANLPIGGSGSGCVEVLREGEANQVRQIVTRCSVAAREIWERLYYSNKWQVWMPIYKGGTGRILWSGGMYMTAGHNAPLSEKITEQPNGIVLVFSRYEDGAVVESNYHHFFIPKAFVAEKNGYGHTFTLAANKYAVVATKYLYINNERITGHADNNATGTANGITYNNASFVLRYVIGV